MTRQATIAGHTITLHARDQYNDYSVVHDYSLEVCEPGFAHGRTWSLGTNEGRARKAFDRACSVVGSHVAAVAVMS